MLQQLQLQQLLRPRVAHGPDAGAAVTARLSARHAASSFGPLCRNAYFPVRTSHSWSPQPHGWQLANRVSSRSGTKYKDSTAIFAWDLISEPR